MEEAKSISFAENGINDIEVGVHLYQALNIGQAELADLNNIKKLKDIAEFVEGQPDPCFTITSVLNTNKNPNIKNIDHLWNYIQLSKQSLETESKLENLKKELKYYE